MAAAPTATAAATAATTAAAAATASAAPGPKVPSRRGLSKALPDGTPPTPYHPPASVQADPCNSEPSPGTVGAAWGALSPPTHWPAAAAAAGAAAAGAAVTAAAWAAAAAGAAAAAAWKAARASGASDQYDGSSTEEAFDSEEEEAVEREGSAGVLRPTNPSGPLVRL